MKFEQLTVSGGAPVNHLSFAAECLTQALLQDYYFNHCNFTHMRWHAVEFKKIHFVHCTFTDCQFDATHFYHCNFYQCTFTRVQINADSVHTLLQECTLDDCVWQGTQRHLKFLKNILLHTSIQHLALYQSHFYAIDLTELIFAWQHMAQVIFDQCQFRHVHAAHQTLDRITFSRCYLEQGDFHQARLLGSYFSECTLKHLDFSGLDIEILQYLKCRLFCVNFSKTKVAKASIFNASHLDQINFTETQLQASSFDESQLTQVDFTSAHITCFNLRSAQLNTINFTHCQIQHVSVFLTRYDNIQWHNQAQKKLFLTITSEERALQAWRAKINS
jgi:uncharacterized protein YjbI with pentapeptide repeats